jgi:hypothetical protein
MATLNLDRYIDAISKLDPLKDSAFIYNKDKWSKLIPRYKKLIIDFENKIVSRGTVVKAYKDYYSGKDGAMRAFMLTMIWGFSDTGYGTHRTNTYIEDPANIALIKKAIDAVKENDLKTAFSDLKQIKELGVSYITKILYFASRAAKHSQYALIYDIRVATALVKLTTPKEISGIVSINPSSKFKDYEKYNALIHHLADKYKLEAEAIEFFLFDQKF